MSVHLTLPGVEERLQVRAGVGLQEAVVPRQRLHLEQVAIALVVADVDEHEIGLLPLAEQLQHDAVQGLEVLGMPGVGVDRVLDEHQVRVERQDVSPQAEDHVGRPRAAVGAVLVANLRAGVLLLQPLGRHGRPTVAFRDRPADAHHRDRPACLDLREEVRQVARRLVVRIGLVRLGGGVARRRRSRRRGILPLNRMARTEILMFFPLSKNFGFRIEEKYPEMASSIRNPQSAIRNSYLEFLYPSSWS